MKPMKPVNVLSYENCYNAAKQFTRFYDFRKTYKNTFYSKALKMGWLKDYTWLKRDKVLVVSYEDCYNAAKEFTRLCDFRRKYIHTFYSKASKMGWLKDYTWLSTEKRPAYTYDECYAEAKKYESSEYFRNAKPGMWGAAYKYGWLKDYIWFKKVSKPRVYTLEKCLEIARNYEYLADLKYDYPGVYDAIHRNCWDEHLSFLKKFKPKYSFEEVEHVALKYDTLQSFRENDTKYYDFAKRYGWLEKFGWLKPSRLPYGHWCVYENNRAEALKYETRLDFVRNSSSAYRIAYKKGWLKDYTWLSITCKPNGYWNVYENNIEEAKKYRTRTEFSKGNQLAYECAKKNGWLDKYDWFDNSLSTPGLTLAILKSGDIEGMSQHQLIELIAAKKLPQDFTVLTYTEEYSERRLGLIRDLIAVRESSKSEAEAEAEIERMENVEQENSDEHLNQEVTNNGVFSLVFDEGTHTLVDQSAQNTTNTTEPQVSLPSATFSRIRIYDDTLKLKPGDKAAEFIAKEEWTKLWNATLYANEDGKANEEYETIKAMECGEFSGYVRDKFVSEYETVVSIKEDEDYCFHDDGKYCPPSLMQKLMAYKMSVNKEYGNWCGTGAGKTNAFLFSTRYIKAKVTVAIVPNDVIATIVDAINGTYPNSDIVIPTYPEDIKTYDRNRYTYILFNYEKFQEPNKAKAFINRLFDTNTIDFVCLDEAHNIKVRDENTASNRSKYISAFLVRGRELNPEMRTLFMTATPCPNCLSEPRSIVEALTGKKYPEIGNRTSIMNVHNAYKALILNGFRYVPKYPIVIKERTVPIDCSNDAELYDELTSDRNIDISEIEYALARRKLETIKNELRDGTVVYSNWVNGMAQLLNDSIKSWGYNVECYNGLSGDKEGREQVLKRFLNGKTNVLVCSQPISTGVNGLQKRCNKMIIVSLPWTDDNYTQLKGRIYRQGSTFKEVEFVIPQIYINLSDGKVWSWDALRLSAIETKRSLSSATVDGYIQDSYRLNRERLKNMALEALKNGLEEVSVEREDVKVDVNLEETEEQRRIRRKSFVSEIHRRANASKSETIRTWFTREVEKEYHIARRENVNTWIEDPVDRIAGLINILPKRFNRIIDLGCGENKLKTLTNRFVQGVNLNRLDDDTVIEADMAHLEGLVNDGEYDVAVFCLSLWGCGFEVFRQYLNEAYRVLNEEGHMYIVEPADSFGEEKHYGTKEDFIDFVESVGFKKLGRKVEDHYGKLYFEFSKC